MAEVQAIEEPVVSTPRGVLLSVADDVITMKVRAGSVDWRALAALAVALVWMIGWGVSLVELIGWMREGKAVNPGPSMFAHIVATVAGVYCTLLCFWLMLGHERMVVRDGRMWTSSPWLFGMLRNYYDMRQVKSFATSHKECGLEGDGCCCNISNEAYPLTFGYGGHRVSVFGQLPNDAKDWVRDQMNGILAGRKSAAPVKPHGCSCGHCH